MSTSKWIEQSANDCIHSNHHKIHKQTKTNTEKIIDKQAETHTREQESIAIHTYSTHLLLQQNNCLLHFPNNNNNVQ